MNYKIPVAFTPEGKERLRAYYEALGKFVDIFAQVEEAITRTLWHYAKTPPEIAKVVFAGAKIEVSSTYIKQLAKATKTDESLCNDLEYVLQQLGIINGARNDIIHYGATSVAEGNPTVSNALKAKGEPVVFPISPDLLDEMGADLHKITLHLHYRHLGRPWPRVDALARATLDYTLRAPWRYKHPVQPQGRTKGEQSQRSRKRDPKPPRQPRSSSG